VAAQSDSEVLAILARYCRSDDGRLQAWIEKYEGGLRPFAGAWRSPEEIAALLERGRRRSLVVVLEVAAVLVALLGADVLMVLLLRKLFF